MRHLLFLVTLLSASAFGQTVLRVGSGQTYSTIQSAIAASACGDVIEITAGETFTGATAPIVIGKQAGTCTKYTTVRSSKCASILGRRAAPSDASAMSAIRVSGAGTALIDTDQTTANLGAAYWRFQCLDVGLTGMQDYYWLINFSSFFQGASGQVDINQIPHHIIVESSYIHSPVRNQSFGNRCLQMNTGYAEMKNNYFEGCYNPGNTESQGIAASTSFGVHRITNNHIETGAECVIYGGAKTQIMGMHPSIIVEGNDCYRPWTWRTVNATTGPTDPCMYESGGGEHWNNTSTVKHWDCQSDFTWGSQIDGLSSQISTAIKNGYETKGSTKARFRGNTCRHMWWPAFAGQNGPCLLINQVDGSNLVDTFTGVNEEVNAFVEFTNNKAIDTPAGIVVGSGYGVYYNNNHDLIIRDNVFERMGSREVITSNSADPAAAMGILMGVVNRASVDHNTFIATSPTGIGYAMDIPIAAGASGFSVSNNLFEWLGYGIYGPTGNLWTGPIGGMVANSHSWGGNAVINTNTCMNFGYKCPENLRMDTVAGPPPGAGFQTCSSCFTLDDYAAADLVDLSGGNYRPNTTSPLYQKGASRLNIGASIDETDNMTACAVSGCLNPFLDFQILRLQPGSTTAALKYFAYSTEACTVTAGTDPDFVPASPEFQATSSAGQQEREVSITGLSSATLHYLDIDCTLSGTHYHKQVPFITR